jgi:hypothetical protein
MPGMVNLGQNGMMGTVKLAVEHDVPAERIKQIEMT